MAQRYMPRMSAKTVKKVAQSMLSTKSGKKLSDTKFKEFMKQNKDLKKMAYTGKKSTISKTQANKFFKSVVGAAKESGNFKMSRMARKMGIKDKGPAKISDVATKKIYTHATKEELASMPQDTGSTPEQIRKEKRREEMLKTLHKRERAEEIQKEEEAKKKQESGEKGSSDKDSRSSQSVPRGGGTSLSGASQQNAQGGAPTAGATTTPTGQSDRSDSSDGQNQHMRVLLVPLYTLTPNVQGLSDITERLTKLVKTVFGGQDGFEVLSDSGFNQALENLHLSEPPNPNDRGALSALARSVQADLLIIGTVSRKGYTTDISIRLVNPETNQTMSLASLRENSDDVFALEQKIHWQLTNSLIKGGDTSPESGPGNDKPDQDIVELPI